MIDRSVSTTRITRPVVSAHYDTDIPYLQADCVASGLPLRTAAARAQAVAFTPRAALRGARATMARVRRFSLRGRRVLLFMLHPFVLHAATAGRRQPRAATKSHDANTSSAFPRHCNRSGCSPIAWEKYFTDLRCLYFIQIGANGGTTQAYEGDAFWEYQRLYRWRGAVIEANPATFQKLRHNYRDSLAVPLHVAISNRTDTLTFWCPKNNPKLSEVCTGNAHWAQQNPRLLNHAVRVNAIPLAALWDLLLPESVDVLGVDAEGEEYRILMAAPLPVPLPKMIYFETTGFTNQRVNENGPQMLSELRRSLAVQGYSPLIKGGDERERNDLWALNGSLPFAGGPGRSSFGHDHWCQNLNS